jgi:hypothetical protein
MTTMMTIPHAHYIAAERSFLAEIDDFRPGHIIFLCGPSGSGKTYVRHACMRKAFGNPLEWGRGRVPAIETFAMLPNAAYFSSRSFVMSLTDELQVPSLKWLRGCEDVSVKKFLQSVEACSPIYEGLRKRLLTEDAYWKILPHLLEARGCKYISVDQATAFLVNRANKSPTEHTLHLLSFAEESSVMLIMTGVHTATRLWEIHPELRRRISPVWVRPYSPRRKGDDREFLRLLRSMTPYFPFAQDDLLFNMSDDILAATGGIFGELKQLLKRSHKRAQHEGTQCISRRHIESSYYSDDDLRTLWRDIEAFETVSRPGDVSRISTITSQVRRKLNSSKSTGDKL